MNDRERKILEWLGWDFRDGEYRAPDMDDWFPISMLNPIDLNFLAEYVFPWFFQWSIHKYGSGHFVCAKSANGWGYGKNKQLLEACLQAVEQAINGGE
uniref:Uncharacterized protein n=1 Tax=viral metagenome TaxID=1070528 RepID=A0A6M3JSU5_9ZZZZ